MTSIFGGLTALSLFGNTSFAASSGALLSGLETIAVRKSRATFTVPETAAPWVDAAKASANVDAAAVRRMKSVVDSGSDAAARDDADVALTFTTYKALDRLQTLATAAGRASTGSREREQLQATFARGLADLQRYLGTAESDKVLLGFSDASRTTQSAGLAPAGKRAKLDAGISLKTRDATIPGFPAAGAIRISLSKHGMSSTLTLDLSTVPQPPTLEGVTTALNDLIASELVTDASGDPVPDADGNVMSRWQTRFVVTRRGEEDWGISYQIPGSEKIAMIDPDAAEAVVAVSNQLSIDGADEAAGAVRTAAVRRYDDPANDLDAAKRLQTLVTIDRAATDVAAATRKSATPVTLPAGVERPEADATVHADLDIRATAGTPEGGSYVVGTARGDFGAYRSDGEKDLYLTRLDGQGKVVWQRSLGVDGSAEGSAVGIDAAGNVTVAGSVKARIGSSSGRTTDMVVARYSASGAQLMLATVPGVGEDVANALAVGADGAIYVGGRVADSGSPVLVRLDAEGRVVARRTMSGSGAVTALAIDADGSVLMLARDATEARLTRISGTDLDADIGTIALGAVDARALAVSASGAIAVGGAAGGASVAGTAANVRAGGQDGFVTRIDNALSAAVTTYIGDAADDQVDSLAFAGTALYAGGRTTGALDGARRGATDGFVARIDATSGAIGQIDQFGVPTTTTGPVRLAIQRGGGAALDAIGLAAGELKIEESSKLADTVGLRADDSFMIQIDNDRARRVTIVGDETIQTLQKRLQKLLGKAAIVTTPTTAGRLTLQISATPGHTLTLGAGSGGGSTLAGSARGDALAKLGLSPGKLRASAIRGRDDPKVTPGGTFELGLSHALGISTMKSARAAIEALANALSKTRSAYSSLYWDDTKAMLADSDSRGGGVVDAYTQRRIAAYTAAYARLTA